MLREIRDLGFEYAELSHGIRISLLPGIFESQGWDNRFEGRGCQLAKAQTAR